MKLIRSLLVAVAVVTVGIAQAHFVWATLSPDGTTLRLQFAELPNDSVIPEFAGKATPTFVFAGPNEPVKMAQDKDDIGLYLAKLGKPRNVAGADLVYGLMDRTADVYLLHYYAKAATTIETALEAVGTPVELFIVAKDGGKAVELRRNGQAVPGAEIILYSPDGKQTKLAADAAGSAAIPADVAVACVRGMAPETASGTLNGKEYKQIRHYATLAIGEGKVAPTEHD